MKERLRELNPEPNTKVNFKVASLFARKIDLKKESIRFTSGHRGMFAKCDRGYMIIEKQWEIVKKE